MSQPIRPCSNGFCLTMSAAALALSLAPALAHAQSGSSLFVVGEKPSKPASAGSPGRSAAAPKAPSAPVAGAKPVANQGAKLGATQGAKPGAKPVAKAGGTAKPASTASRNKARNRAAVQKPPAAVPVVLSGRWHDSQCIPLTGVTHQPPLFVKRQYEFDDRRKSWQLDAIVYSSDSCLGNTRMLSYRGEGSYAVTGKSRIAADAFDASFDIRRWEATPTNRAGVLTLLNGRCGSGDFEEGRALNLSATGCAVFGIRSIAERPSEFELVRVSDGKFYLGTRSFLPGLRDDRPTQISSYGMSRASQ